MKHYIQELSIYSGNLINLQKKIEIITLFICQDGQYQMIENKLYKYTFPDHTTTIKNYIKQYTLLSSVTPIIDTNNEIYRLPYKHVVKEIKKIMFILHPKSQTSFVIEKNEDKIIDFYFESPHESNQKTLKEDISSLLSYLK